MSITFRVRKYIQHKAMSVQASFLCRIKSSSQEPFWNCLHYWWLTELPYWFKVSLSCHFRGIFSQKITLHKLKFNPQEFKLNIEKLGKLRKLQYLKKNYEFSDVQFNMSSI